MLQYNNALGAALRGKFYCWALMLPITLTLLALPTLATASEPTIVTSIKPLHMIAQAVMGKDAAIARIVPDGADAHDYILRPSDAEKATQGDLLIWLGPLAEPYLTRVAARPARVQLDISQLPDLILLPQRRLVEWDEKTAAHAHNAPFDQHLWLNTENAKRIANTMAKRIAELDPTNAERYKKNANDFALSIDSHIPNWKSAFAKVDANYFIAYHDAYHYLEQEFDLQVATVLTLEPEIKPGAKHLLNVKSAIDEYKVTCFVTEPGYDPHLLEKVMPDKAKQVVLDVHGSGIAISTDSYIDFMDNIANSLSQCLRK